MSLCVFDHDGGCANTNVGELFGKRCIEADNVLKTEQTLCKYHCNRLQKTDCSYAKKEDGKIMCTNPDNDEDYGEKCTEVYCLYPECYICPHHVIEVENTIDNVNHPSHYTQGGIECIKAIEASMTPEEFQGYCKGNVIKYCWRFREKNGLEDLKKAQVYLGWMIESKEKQEQNTH